MSEQINLSIIIVSWRVCDLLEQTLVSIYQNLPNLILEVIVVDNASSDGSIEMVKNKFSQVKLIVNNTNLGFATACWQGVAVAQGECFLFLNDDIKLYPDTLEIIYKSIRANKKIGVLGGQILNPDFSIQPSVRNFPRVFDLWIILLKLHHLFPNVLKKYLCSNFNYNQPANVQQVMGALFALRREVWEQLNGFDKNFFIWFEEVDFCKRARLAGFEIYFEPAAKIIHYRGASFKQLTAISEQRLFNNSLYYYVSKHHSRLAYYFLKLFYPLSIFLAAFVQAWEKINRKK